MTGSRRIKKKEKVKARFPRKKRQERGKDSIRKAKTSPRIPSSLPLKQCHTVPS